MILTDKLSNIANAIRSKTGKNEEMTLDEMPVEIEGIFGNKVEKPFDCHSVTFVYGDKSYVRSVADGDTCADPVERGLIPTPTKESTAQYNYTFYGWGASDGGAADANILKNITEDKTMYAIFTATVRYYTITWLDDDGTVLKTESKAYGSTPSYAPSKSGYDFAGWSPAVSAVTGDVTYTAQWEVATIVIEEIADDWDAIIAATADGTYRSKYRVGNYKPMVTASNKTFYMQIVAMDADPLADGSGNAATTWIPFHPSGDYIWNYSGALSYYVQSVVWPNFSNWPNMLTTIEEDLPSNIKDAIKPVIKRTYGSGSVVETTDSIWIPSATEIGGSLVTNGLIYSKVFTDDNSRKRVYGGYFLRDTTGNKRYFCGNTGKIATMNSDSSSVVLPCFCL